MTHSKGISWFDDCRIPFEDTQNPATNPKYRLEGGYKLAEKGKISEGSITQFRSSLNETDTRGRFPANLLVCDDMLNDGVINGGGSYTGIVIRKRKGYKLNPNSDNLHSTSPDNYGDKGSNSRYYDIDKWFDKIINYE